MDKISSVQTDEIVRNALPDIEELKKLITDVS